MQHTVTTGGILAELTDGDGSGLVILAERLPRGTRVRVRRSDERRLVALLADARRDARRASDEAALAGDASHELCSAHFLSGAGWAWRVTAALARSRRANANA